MGRPTRKQRQTKAARVSLSLQQIDNTTFNETDEVETLNAEEEAFINNNYTVAVSINNEEDHNNMDIADDGSNMEQPIYRKHSSSSSESNRNTANSHILPNSIEAPSIDSAKSKRLSKSQRNNRNSKI